MVFSKFNRFLKEKGWDKRKVLFVVLASLLVIKLGFNTYNKYFYHQKIDKTNIIQIQRMRPSINNGSIVGYGNINNGKVISVTSEVDSIVKKIYVRSHSSVKKGTLIMEMDPKGITEKFNAAKIKMDLTKAKKSAYEEMYRKNLVSKAEIDSIFAEFDSAKSDFKSTKDMIDGLKVRSPFTGTISDIMVNEGQLVSQKQTPLYTISRDGKSELIISLPGKYMKYLKKDQLVNVTCDDKSFFGKVMRFDKSINERTGSIGVGISSKEMSAIPNGTSCEAKILHEVSNSNIIPGSAVVIYGEEIGVKKINSISGMVEFQPIQIISDENGEILCKGMSEESLVVTLGHGMVEIGKAIPNNVKINEK